MKATVKSAKTAKAPSGGSEPIVDPAFQPSARSLANQDAAVIFYSTLVDNVADTVKTDQLDSLGSFQESSALSASKLVLEVIDHMTLDEVLTHPPQAVTDFLQFLRSKVPIKTMLTIASTWPTAIPRPHIQMDSFIHLVIRMAHESRDPAKFMYWLCLNFPPLRWIMKPTSTNPEIMAVCLSHVGDSKERPVWTLIDTEQMFRIYRIDKEETVQILEAKATQTRVEPDKRVVILGTNGEEVSSFKPVDTRLTALWGACFDKKRGSYPMFLTCFDEVCPPIYQKAFVSAITCVDGVLVRGLISDKVVNDTKATIDALYDVFAYSQRVHVLIGTILGSQIETPAYIPEAPFGDKNPLTLLYKVFFEKFGVSYVTGFMRNLIQYIDNQPDLGLSNIPKCDVKKTEVAVFTVMKYIINSLPFVAQEIRVLASYLRAFILIRFNTKAALYSILSEFFGIRFICSILESPTKYIPDLVIKNPSNIRGICRIVRVLFKMGRMSGEFDKFSSFNKRLERHLYPKLEEFIFSLGDVPAKPFEFAVPNEDQFGKSMVFLMKNIAEHHKPLMKELDQLKHSEIPLPGLLGWGFATAISRFFKYSFDNPDSNEKLVASAQINQTPSEPVNEQPKVNEEPKPDVPKKKKKQKEPTSPEAVVQPIEQTPIKLPEIGVQPIEQTPIKLPEISESIPDPATPELATQNDIEEKSGEIPEQIVDNEETIKPNEEQIEEVMEELPADN